MANPRRPRSWLLLEQARGQVIVGLNRFGRAALDNEAFAKAFWWVKAQHAPVRTELSRRAMASQKISSWYWGYRDWRANRWADPRR